MNLQSDIFKLPKNQYFLGDFIIPIISGLLYGLLNRGRADDKKILVIGLVISSVTSIFMSFIADNYGSTSASVGGFGSVLLGGFFFGNPISLTALTGTFIQGATTYYTDLTLPIIIHLAIILQFTGYFYVSTKIGDYLENKL